MKVSFVPIHIHSFSKTISTPDAHHYRRRHRRHHSYYRGLRREDHKIDDLCTSRVSFYTLCLLYLRLV